jgi:hypothetical protein
MLCCGCTVLMELKGRNVLMIPRSFKSTKVPGLVSKAPSRRNRAVRHRGTFCRREALCIHDEIFVNGCVSRDQSDRPSPSIPQCLDHSTKRLLQGDSAGRAGAIRNASDAPPQFCRLDRNAAETNCVKNKRGRLSTRDAHPVPIWNIAVWSHPSVSRKPMGAKSPLVTG